MPRYKKKKENEQKTRNRPVIEDSSGNVFFDIGFPEHEAVNLLARSELSFEIQEIIREKGWTQAEAARILGVRQPRISDLMNRRIEKFTVDMLMKWLFKLGKDVHVVVSDRVA